MNIRRLVGAALISVGALVVTADLACAASFAQTHPRRAEINHRLTTQNFRIAHALYAGKISPREARRLRAHHGGLTRVEQRALNQQENAVSRRISH